MYSRFNQLLLSSNISLTMVGLMAVLPFISFHHALPIPSFYSEWIAAAFGILALLPLLKRESWQPLEIPQIALIFPGFTAILFMQWMLGMLHSTQYALLFASYLVWAFFLIILGNHLRRELGWETIACRLAWFLVLGGVLNSLFVLLQYANNSGWSLPFIPVFPGYGAMGQANHLADYMALATVSLIYLFAKKRIAVPLLAGIGLLFLAMLAFSGSRSTWLYLLALVVLAFLLRAISIKSSSSISARQIQQTRRLFRLALLILPAFALVQWLIFLLPGELATLPTERLIEKLGGTVAINGLAIRLHIWQESLQIFMQSPWLGIGAGQMRWASFITLDIPLIKDMPATYEHAHNLIIHLLAEMGIGAALLLLAAIFAWLRSFQWRHINLERWWLLAMLAVTGIHSMLEYPLWYAYFLGLTAFLLGAGNEQSTQVRLPFIGRAAVVTMLITSIALLGSTLAANIKLERWIERGLRGQITAHNQAEFYETLAWVNTASLLSPYAHLIYAIALNPDSQNLGDKLWLSESALRFIPMRTTAYRHVLLLELNGDHEQAVQFLRRAIQAYPNDFKRELQNLPLQYWQVYLRLLSEAVPPVGHGD